MLKVNSKKPKTPDEPKVKCETCEDYKNYMMVDPDDNASLKHNPVPKDAMSLKELGTKTNQEILKIVNKVGIMENKSDRREMYACGYGFTWGELKTIAEFKGFKLVEANTRKPQYELGATNDEASGSEEDIIYNNGTFKLEQGHRQGTEVKKFTLSKNTCEMIDVLFGSISNQIKSRVLDIMLNQLLKSYIKLKKENKFSVVLIAKEKRVI